ncbi:hypothetical protein PENSPDRAFT_569156 [Peniophora sp. CONT]|nr:hypothetical protein PENSPDRAFT_569156 [Peniophora sp. CONT]
MDQYSPLNSVLSSVPLEQRSRVIRSARKLEQVLGTNAFLVESSTSRPLQVLPTPLTLRHKHSQSLNAMDSSSASTTYEDASSVMFTHSNNSSVSTLPTDDSRPASPVKIAPVAPTFAPSPRTPKRKRGLDAPSLFIEVQPVTIPADDARLALPLTPVTAPVNVATPTTPRTPTTPTVFELAEQRARKLTKISRTLGENVPPELVFNTFNHKKSRRASLSSAIDPLPTPNYSHTVSAPPMPVFASGPAQVAGETWVGSWNRPDIRTVQTELRALRRR